MFRLRRFLDYAFLQLVAVTLAITASATHAQDAKPAPATELKVSAALGPAYALGAAAARWAKRIGEKGEGQLTAKFFPGAILAQRDPAREFAALRDDTIDVAIGSTLYWSMDAPPLGVAGLPWLAPEPAQLDALLGSPVVREWSSALEKAGVVPLAFAALGHRAVASREKAIRAPADLAGVKVRVSDAPLLTSLYGALGAQPLTMAFADSQSAFAAGTLDLQDGAAATFAGAHLGAVGVKYVVLWGAIAEVAVFAMNRSRWDTLSDADRGLIKDTADEMARELTTLARQEDETALASLRRSGIAIVRLTAAERAAFVEAVRATYDKLSAGAGESLVRAAEAAVKASKP